MNSRSVRLASGVLGEPSRFLGGSFGSCRSHSRHYREPRARGHRLFNGPFRVWLRDIRGGSSARGFARDRVDRILRAHLLGASPEAQDRARAKAVELRSTGNLLVCSALAAIFLEPEWSRPTFARGSRNQSERSLGVVPRACAVRETP